MDRLFQSFARKVEEETTSRRNAEKKSNDVEIGQVVNMISMACVFQETKTMAHVLNSLITLVRGDTNRVIIDSGGVIDAVCKLVNEECHMDMTPCLPMIYELIHMFLNTNPKPGDIVTLLQPCGNKLCTGLEHCSYEFMPKILAMLVSVAHEMPWRIELRLKLQRLATEEPTEAISASVFVLLHELIADDMSIVEDFWNSGGLNAIVVGLCHPTESISRDATLLLMSVAKANAARRFMADAKDDVVETIADHLTKNATALHNWGTLIRLPAIWSRLVTRPAFINAVLAMSVHTTDVELSVSTLLVVRTSFSTANSDYVFQWFPHLWKIVDAALVNPGSCDSAMSMLRALARVPTLHPDTQRQLMFRLCALFKTESFSRHRGDALISLFDRLVKDAGSAIIFHSIRVLLPPINTLPATLAHHIDKFAQDFVRGHIIGQNQHESSISYAIEVLCNRHVGLIVQLEQQRAAVIADRGNMKIPFPTCPLRLEVFRCPIIASDDRTYEFDGILELEKRNQVDMNPVLSPITREPLEPVCGSVRMNRAVTDVIQSLVGSSVKMHKEASGATRLPLARTCSPTRRYSRRERRYGSMDDPVNVSDGV